MINIRVKLGPSTEQEPYSTYISVIYTIFRSGLITILFMYVLNTTFFISKFHYCYFVIYFLGRFFKKKINHKGFFIWLTNLIFY